MPFLYRVCVIFLLLRALVDGDDGPKIRRGEVLLWFFPSRRIPKPDTFFYSEIWCALGEMFPRATCIQWKSPDYVQKILNFSIALRNFIIVWSFRICSDRLRSHKEDTSGFRHQDNSHIDSRAKGVRMKNSDGYKQFWWSLQLLRSIDGDPSARSARVSSIADLFLSSFELIQSFNDLSMEQSCGLARDERREDQETLVWSGHHYPLHANERSVFHASRILWFSSR